MILTELCIVTVICLHACCKNLLIWYPCMPIYVVWLQVMINVIIVTGSYRGRLHKTKSHYIDVRSGPTVITSVNVHTCAQLKTLTNKLLAKQKCIEVVAISR